MRFRCPNCQQQVEVLEQRPAAGVETEFLTCPGCNSRFSFSDDPESTQVSAVGQRIGQFELRKTLGEGAFGTVHQAWDHDLHRHVAIKIPRRDRITKESGRQILREARAAAQIRHPQIVQVYEVGQLGDSLYIVSEFIDGVTLSEWLKLRTLPARDAARLMVTICRAVEAAHAAGIVHRDLKPGNILMDLQHQPHVADFGLARREAGPDITVTQDGRIVGTPAYMSPEQARGENDQISPASDVWALGVTLYEMLTGQRPFSATSSHTVLFRILTEDATPPRRVNPAVPRELDTIVQKSMSKDPAARYNTAGALADDLQRHLDGLPILAQPAGPVERCWKAIRRHPASSLMILPLSMAPLAFLAWFLLLRNTPGIPGPVPVVSTMPVRMQHVLSGDNPPQTALANWAVVPLIPETRLPDESRIIRRISVAEFSDNLLPGEYLVIVDVPGFGFHEVYRTVPAERRPSETLQFNHLWWEIDPDGTVLLPNVPIQPAGNVETGMVRIPGGRFQMGDDRSDRLRHERSVEEFLIDATEVTCEQFVKWRELPGDYGLPRDNYPVVSQSWNSAIGFAEFAGKRLLTEAEFEYAATNRGQLPAGTGATSGATGADGFRVYAPAGQPAADQLPDFPVFGLNSNVAEWTDSLMLPYPGMRALDQDLQTLMQVLQSRTVRGGPVNAGANDRSRNSWDQPPAARMAWQVTTKDTEIGFRCARSPQARFLP